jgi:HPt (histidine-containing phosphotransfer) domain-containing protein
MARLHTARSHGARQRRARTGVRARSPDEDLVARAEAAMAVLSMHFAGWMQDELQRLDRLGGRAAAMPGNLALINELYRAAHDIKGEASTFGFPAVARVTASLCHLIADAPHRDRLPPRLITRHIAAARNVMQPEQDHAALVDALEQLTARFLTDAQAQDDSPEIPSPPLAPRNDD